MVSAVLLFLLCSLSVLTGMEEEGGRVYLLLFLDEKELGEGEGVSRKQEGCC